MSPTLRGAAAMQQVADWLERLGLGQYAQRFAENDISFSVLPDLTDQDLKDIGVSLGHRRQSLREIANLGKMAAPSSSAPPPTAPPITTTVAPHAEATAERRQVTVMFSDLVGSTALSARMAEGMAWKKGTAASVPPPQTSEDRVVDIFQEWRSRAESLQWQSSTKGA
jgi:uncharacterized protein YjiS (DUF1127 family)